MNKNLRDTYIEKMSAQIKIWDSSFEKLKATIKRDAAGIKIDTHKSHEAWRKKKENLESKINELKVAGTDKYDDIKSNTQEVWEDISVFVKDMHL
jgi:hypothetical protein